MRKTISSNNIIRKISVFLLYISYVLPADYIIGSLPYALLNTIRLVVLIALSIVIIGKNKKYIPTAALLLLALTAPIASTVFNSAPSYTYGIWILVNNLLLFLATKFLAEKEKDCLKIAKWATAIGCIANSISMIYLGETRYIGTRHYYLLDQDNISFFYTMPSIILAIICDDINYNKIKKSTIIITAFHLLAYWSVNSLTAYAVLIATLIIELTYSTKLYSFISRRKIVQALFIAMLAIILTIGSNRELALFISQNTGKSVTISGRTEIWETAIKLIKQRLLIGYGYEDLWYRIQIFGISHIHNILLQLLYNGGIVHLVFIVVFYLKLKKKNPKHNTLIFLLLIATIFDFYLNKYLFIIPFALLDIDTVANHSAIKEKK